MRFDAALFLSSSLTPSSPKLWRGVSSPSAGCAGSGMATSPTGCCTLVSCHGTSMPHARPGALAAVRVWQASAVS